MYDLTGPFAGGGSDFQYLSAKIIMDHIKRQDGAGKDVNDVMDVDPITIRAVPPKALVPGLEAIAKMAGEEYMRVRPDTVLNCRHPHPTPSSDRQPVLGGPGNMIGGFVAAVVFAEIISVSGLYMDLEEGMSSSFSS